MSFIHKKLKNRLNGWFSKALSQGGKEILLKSIALALPVYAMTCFKLSKDLCDKLKSAMIEYWWSSGNNRRKIPWVAWQKLCLSKEDGGLGFHDITLFNQALLCKQAWRLFEYPDSLLAKVMKSRYYDTDQFLLAHLGYRPSYAWRSILFGRELLYQGLVRSIGNGRETNAFLAKWIFDDVPRTPIRTEHPTDSVFRVVDLIDRENGSWKADMVRHLFIPSDADYILSLRISMTTPDTFVWGFTKHGRYTSQSGYKLLISSHPDYQVETSPLEKSLWKKVWKLKTSPKINHFIWKVLHEALAVASSLQRRGMNVASACPMCNSNVESTAHVLFTCPEAMRVWSLSGLSLPPSGFSSNSVFLNIQFLTEHVHRDTNVGVEFYWILWQIWKARNSFVFERFRLSAEAIINRAKDSSLEWKTVNHSTSNHHTNSVPASHWLHPTAPSLKCNLACFRPNALDFVGLSWILRDNAGQVRFHARDSRPPAADSLSAELLCLLWCITSLKDLRQPDVIFECSSQQAIEAINFSSRFPAYRILIQDIKTKLSWFSKWQISYAPPASNSIAIKIAKSAVVDNRAHSYIQASAPSWLFLELEQDAQH